MPQKHDLPDPTPPQPLFRFDRRLLANFDWVMLLAVLLIATCGLLNLYSATSHSNPGFFYRQIAYYIAGLGLIGGMLCFDYRRLAAYHHLIYLGMLALLAAALWFGASVANTQRWIRLGFFNLQPSEPAKLALVISLANYYARHDTAEGLGLRDLITPGLLTFIPFFLIYKQPDLGTGLLLLAIFASMTLFAKLRLRTFAVLTSASAIGAYLGYKFLLKPYQLARITTFLNPDAPENRAAGGYHIIQSKIAIGSGMKFGKGFGNGTQVHLDFLPERHTDFAFSVWAEEWGFVGSLVLLGLYVFLLLWGLNTAIQARDKFGVLLAIGIVSLIFWQAWINVAMVLGLTPVVGMPLPLFSYGGSSLLTTLAGIGILMNIRMRRFQSLPRHQ